MFASSMNSPVQRQPSHSHDLDRCVYLSGRSACTERERAPSLRCCLSIYFSVFFARESSFFAVSVRVSVSAFSLSYLSHILLALFSCYFTSPPPLSVLLNPLAPLQLYIQANRRRKSMMIISNQSRVFLFVKEEILNPLLTAFALLKPTHELNESIFRRHDVDSRSDLYCLIDHSCIGFFASI